MPTLRHRRHRWLAAPFWPGRAFSWRGRPWWPPLTCAAIRSLSPGRVTFPQVRGRWWLSSNCSCRTPRDSLQTHSAQTQRGACRLCVPWRWYGWRRASTQNCHLCVCRARCSPGW